MRVALDMRLAYYGGAGRFVRTVAEALENSSAINVIGFGPASIELQVRKLVNVAWQSCDIPPFSISEQLRLPDFIERLSVDVVHFPYLTFPIWSRVPTIVTIHDLVWFNRRWIQPWEPRGIYARFMTRQALKRAAAVTCVSQTVKDEIKNRLAATSDRPPFVTYNAISRSLSTCLEQFKTTHRDPTLLLYVGTAKPWKRVDVAIAAVGLLKRKGRPFKLAIAGVPARNSNMDLRGLVARHNVADRVEFQEAISEESLAKLYATAAVYLMPSEHEGFGLTTLEALAAGCPVIAADVPIHREIAADAAEYSTPGSAEAWAHQLETLLDNNQRLKSMSFVGPARAAAFSRSRLSATLTEIYTQAREK